MIPCLMSLSANIAFTGVLWTLDLHLLLVNFKTLSYSFSYFYFTSNFLLSTFMISSPVSGIQPLSEPLKVNKLDPGFSSSRSCSLEVDCETNKHSDGESSISNAHMNNSPEINADMTGKGTDVEIRYSCEPAGNHDDCSTSETHGPENSRVLQRHRSHGTGERSKRKRWRGRYDKHDSVPDVQQELTATAAATSTNLLEERQVLI